MPFMPKGWEIVIILVVVLLIFGPKNLPKLGSAIGRTVKNLREGMDGGKRGDAAQAIEADDEPAQASGEDEAPDEDEQAAQPTASEKAD